MIKELAKDPELAETAWKRGKEGDVWCSESQRRTHFNEQGVIN